MAENPSARARTPRDQLQDLYLDFLEHRDLGSSSCSYSPSSPRGPDVPPDHHDTPIAAESPDISGRDPPAPDPSLETPDPAATVDPSRDPADLPSQPEGSLDQDEVEKLLQQSTDDVASVSPLEGSPSPPPSSTADLSINQEEVEKLLLQATENLAATDTEATDHHPG